MTHTPVMAPWMLHMTHTHTSHGSVDATHDTHTSHGTVDATHDTHTSHGTVDATHDTHIASFNRQPSARFRRPSPKLQSEEILVFDLHMYDEGVIIACTFLFETHYDVVSTRI